MKSKKEINNPNPIMVPYFPSLSKPGGIDLYGNMFVEDIHLAIMPIGGHPNKQEIFSVKFYGIDSESKKAQDLMRNLGEFNSYNTTELICDTLNNIAHHISYEGRVLYEIINNDGQHHFQNFTSRNLFKFFSYYIQIIPRKDQAYWKKKISIIHKKRIWEIKVPKELGGFKNYSKILKKMTKFNHLTPEFYTQEGAINAEIFDFKLYQRKNNIYLNSATLKWGWNRRDWSQEFCTEFYTFYKMLSFRKSQAILRNFIIAELNTLLSRLSIQSNFYVNGLPKPYEIQEVIKSLIEGELSFSEASDKTSI